MDLPTKAERNADQARRLANFSGLSLPDVRQKVTEMLRLIGQIENIFSTYTKHDISHIDAMLEMLDWLIPQKTAGSMTPVDWLAIVLAIYLHDLGMMVTAEEYRNRMNNSAYKTWRDSLSENAEGREFLDRASRMEEADREKFYFQEHIRRGHGARIREWITGRPSTKWGQEGRVIATAIEDLLKPLPGRFREYLAIICESHHANDLDNSEKYPLYASVGSKSEETINVQYAAILLRTADLLHVTKDRVPSVAFQTIGFSDPMGVYEWSKQSGVFSVRHKKRRLEPTHPESTVIVIAADFNDEAPFFALSEYRVYADEQIQQSRRWAETSRMDPDAKDYEFPWTLIEGDLRLEGVPPQPLSFQLDRGRLLNLLVGHTIYNDPTVAVRELVQNSLDAVRFQHHLDTRGNENCIRGPVKMGRVVIGYNPTTRELSVQDDGVGMDLDVIQNHLMRVGSSFYNTPKFEAEYQDYTPISRFGIGVLTCFMVSNDIEIITVKSGKGYRIRMTSVHTDYLLREISLDHIGIHDLLPHGTQVKLRLRKETVDTSKQSISEIVRHWIILPECEVIYREAGLPDEKIGFPTPEDALRHFHRLAADRRGLIGISLGEATEFKTKIRTGSLGGGAVPPGASYQMAFGITQSYRPEWSYATQPHSDLPVVCIEGIRVADSLPGCSHPQAYRSPNALLSVRGDRSFRTTVSRAGLELDENYDRVGTICGEMLFEHLRDEVARISDQSGNPLSQASTAAKWLLLRLQGFFVQPKAAQHIDILANDQPSMVIERVGLSKSPTTTRALISRSELATETTFWTIESRLVDSLGEISRDLGHELSLNDFLGAFAPDARQLNFSPLLPDAHRFLDFFIDTHFPSKVEFSKRHRQSAVQWSIKYRNDISHKTKELDMLHRSYSYMDGRYYRSDDLFEKFVILSDLLTNSSESAIDGDDPEVTVVSSRVGIFYSKSSVFAPIIELFKTAISKIDTSGKVLRIPGAPQEGIKALIQLGLGLYQFTELDRGLQGARWHQRADLSQNPDFWHQYAGRANQLLGSLGITGRFGSDFQLDKSSESIFTATTFWTDWWQQNDSVQF